MEDQKAVQENGKIQNENQQEQLPVQTDPVEAKTGTVDQTAKIARLEKQLFDPDYQRYLAEKNARPAQQGAKPDFEIMTANERMDYIQKMVETAMTSVAETTGKRIQELDAGFNQYAISERVGKLRSLYSDFAALEPHIIKAIERNPHLEVEEAYKIAKHDRTLENLNRNEIRAADPSQVVSQTPSNIVEKQPETVEEAVEQAWRKHLGNKTLDDLEEP